MAAGMGFRRIDRKREIIRLAPPLSFGRRRNRRLGGEPADHHHRRPRGSVLD